jgi:hypothetical protein
MPSTPPDFCEALSRDLVSAFLGELMAVTRDASTQDVFQQALQAYCDGLRQWMDPADCPPVSRPQFPLVEGCMMNETTGDLSFRLSSEGQAFFRAWVRRRAALPSGAWVTPYAWAQ